MGSDDIFTKEEPCRLSAKLLLRHFPIIAIVLVSVWLTVGIIVQGSVRAITGIALFTAITVATYLVLVGRVRISDGLIAVADCLSVSQQFRPRLIFSVCCGAIAIASIHLAFFDGMTLSAVFAAKDNVEAARIRQAILEHLPTWMVYANAFALKALFPIGLLLAVIYRRPWLATVTSTVGIFYTFCMLQKSGPVVLAAPTITYFLLAGRWRRAGAGFLMVATSVYALGALSNPLVQPDSVRAALTEIGRATITRSQQERETFYKRPAPPPVYNSNWTSKDTYPSLTGALAQRIFITPGDIAAKWFEAIPAEVPYEHGCGYRFLAPFLNCNFKNFSVALNNRFNPDDRRYEMHGTVNSASMMTAYANFGFIGIAISGVLHGLLAWGLYVVFRNAIELSPAFNVTYILLLSSGDLFTILFSGGWGLAILLYVSAVRPRTLSAGNVKRGKPVFEHGHAISIRRPICDDPRQHKAP